MVNQKHLALLSQSVAGWNQWRQENPAVSPDFSYADLSNIDLSHADFSNANFSYAQLSNTSFGNAVLRSANLSNAILSYASLNKADLSHANLDNAVLSKATLNHALLNNASLNHATLSNTTLNHADLRGASLSNANLSFAILQQADLSHANLSSAILRHADFSYANLSFATLNHANLAQAQFLSAQLNQTSLTGICLEDCALDLASGLNSVVCDYVYLKAGQAERWPPHREQVLGAGELAQLVQQRAEAVLLSFEDGIDWKACLLSLQAIQASYGEDSLTLQSIEQQGNSGLRLRLKIKSGTAGADIEQAFNQHYETQLAALEVQYYQAFQATPQEIITVQQQNADLLEIVKLLAGKPPKH